MPQIYSIICLFVFFSCSSPTREPKVKEIPKPISPTIAITIDDLPGVNLDDYQEVTDKLLTSLKKYQVPAIGFVNENNLYRYYKHKLDSTRLKLLDDWLAAGMELGNHTYSHPDYNRLTFEEFTACLLYTSPSPRD